MALTSVISLALLRERSSDAIEIVADQPKVTVFKGEEVETMLRIRGPPGRWTGVEFESIMVDGPVECVMGPRRGDGVGLLLKPKAAGRFTRFEVRMELSDVIGLFALKQKTELTGFVIDSLPLSLLIRVRSGFVPPLVIGERPASTAGKGQEFYGIEMYSERSESRDILWKRLAKDPYRPLLARVREANNPESVKIIVAHGRIATEIRSSCVDLECEALGFLGRALLLAGVRCDISTPGGMTYAAETDEELVEAIMEVSTVNAVSPPGLRVSDRSTIFVLVGAVGEETMQGAARCPTVLIRDNGGRAFDRQAVSFTGAEDLTNIVNRALGS
jgi:hypothetical protein